MSVDVGGRTYRTLNDDILVNGSKVYEITVDGSKVYPEDSAELEGNPYIVKFAGHGLLDYPNETGFVRSGYGKVYMGASYTAYMSFAAVYGFYPPEHEDLYSVDDGYDENGKRYFKVTFKNRERWPGKQYSQGRILSSVVAINISNVKPYGVGNATDGQYWSRFFETGTSSAINGTHSMEDNYGNPHYASNPQCLYHTTGDSLGIDWCRAVVSGIKYAGEEWNYVPGPINPSGVVFSVNLSGSSMISSSGPSEYEYTDAELVFTEAAFNVEHERSGGGWGILSYGYGYYRPSRSSSNPNDTRVPITDILYTGMSSDARYEQSHVSRSDLYMQWR